MQQGRMQRAVTMASRLCHLIEALMMTLHFEYVHSHAEQFKVLLQSKRHFANCCLDVCTSLCRMMFVQSLTHEGCFNIYPL